MWKKNDEIRMAITDLTNEGSGVGHADGCAVFVKDTGPGDAGTVRIIKAKKNYAYGIMTRLETASDWRVPSACPVSGPCGGCQLCHVAYDKQLAWKQQKVKNCLERIGGLKGIEVLPVLGMDEPWHYRNKAQYPVGYDREGRLTAGFYAGHSHRIVPSEDCRIQDERSNRIRGLVLSWMEEHRISAYDEETGKGLVRHIIVRVGAATGEIMTGLVVNGTKLPAAEDLIERLRTVPGMTSVCPSAPSQTNSCRKRGGFSGPCSPRFELRAVNYLPSCQLISLRNKQAAPLLPRPKLRFHHSRHDGGESQQQGTETL